MSSGLLLLRHSQYDIHQALRYESSEACSIRTACRDLLLHHVDDRTVQALLLFLLRRIRYFTFGHHPTFASVLRA